MARVKITQDDIMAVLAEYGRALPQRPEGENWHTLAELATRANTTVAAIKYRIDQARRQGCKVETSPGSVVADDGRLHRTMYWRVTPP